MWSIQYLSAAKNVVKINKKTKEKTMHEKECANSWQIKLMTYLTLHNINKTTR